MEGYLNNYVEKEHEEKPSKRFNPKLIALFIAIIAIASVSIYFYATKHSSCGEASGVCPAPTGYAVASPDSDVIATVNGHDIGNDYLDKAYEMYFFVNGYPEAYKQFVPRTQFINQTIIEYLLYDEASSAGYSPDTIKAEEKLKESMQKAGKTIEDFRQMIENKSFSYDFFVDNIARQVMLTEFINDTILPEVKVSDDEVKDYYDENEEQFITPERIRASHILVNTSDEAQEIIQELDKGADFAELAEEHSIGPTSVKGGDLGYFSQGQMVEEFETAAFALQDIGDYTKTPVKTTFGYHIIKLTGRQPSSKLEFDDVKDDISRGLLQQKQSMVMNNYVDSLWNKASITISDDE